MLKSENEKKLFAYSGIEKVQSHINDFPIKVAFSKDTKPSYKIEFKGFFLFLKAFE